ncbi:MAG: hypothetical protein HOW73_22760 [Polyangiaceae bacterium]|nr:hypothetical protein [Polyangiaceae bacterium]
MAKRSYASVHLFPVRHHSPRTSFVLERMLERVKPALVLVEGPEDATPLIGALVDPETVPPVAILGYRADGKPGSALWPFAAYSPEYVALRWAVRNGVEARFIDISTGQSLATERPRPKKHAPDEHRGLEGDAPPEELASDATPFVADDSMFDRIAEIAGFRSFEEFWEASFEAPDYDESSFRAALVGYAELVRHEGADVDYHRARDAFMAKRIDEAIAAGTPPDRIVAVLGAAHAAALAISDVDDKLVKTLKRTVKTATTIVPFSFPRLSEQTGYGAGNRAPQFYQRAWDAGLSFRRAALEVLIDFSEHLRVRGFASSLADTIEAYRLACMLADLRQKSEPGLDEVREATVATMCRGDATHVDAFLWPTVIGRNVGKVASRIGKNSLQEEFWREVEHRRLPRTDAPEEFVLKLNDPVQIKTSIFLHRLRVADVPYASFLGTGTIMGRGRDFAEEPGGYSALSRVKEAWHAQWTPATDVSLVERIVHGETLGEVCERLLAASLRDATTTAAAASVLLEAVVADAPATAASALTACDRLASADDDLPSLAGACRSLSGLVSYGNSRHTLSFGVSAIEPLCVKTFERALLVVVDACRGNDEAVEPVKPALRILHEVAMGQPLCDRGAWLAAARRLAHDFEVHPATAGMAAALLYLAQEIDEEEVAVVVEQRLSDTLEPERAASFLAGFLEVNALVLVRSRPVVAALDAFLLAIEKDRFRDALPVLRRAFASLGATERRYLVEQIVRLRRLADHAQEAARVLNEQDAERLRAMNEDVARAMEELDDLL